MGYGFCECKEYLVNDTSKNVKELSILIPCDESVNIKDLLPESQSNIISPNDFAITNKEQHSKGYLICSSAKPSTKRTYVSPNKGPGRSSMLRLVST